MGVSVVRAALAAATLMPWCGAYLKDPLAVASLPADAVSVFFLGPGSTGTRTMQHLIQMALPWAGTCHDQCVHQSDPRTYDRKFERWDRASWDHDEAFFRNWRARNNTVIFLDHGQLSDWRWLYRTIAGARFVLMTRKLEPWALSRVRHKCTAEEIAGRMDACVNAISFSIVQAADHQDCVTTHFQGNAGHRFHFVPVDVCDEPIAAARMRISAAIDLAEEGGMVWRC